MKRKRRVRRVLLSFRFTLFMLFYGLGGWSVDFRVLKETASAKYSAFSGVSVRRWVSEKDPAHPGLEVKESVLIG